jgi:hypothetical protein
MEEEQAADVAITYPVNPKYWATLAAAVCDMHWKNIVDGIRLKSLLVINASMES